MHRLLAKIWIGLLKLGWPQAKQKFRNFLIKARKGQILPSPTILKMLTVLTTIVAAIVWYLVLSERELDQIDGQGAAQIQVATDHASPHEEQAEREELIVKPNWKLPPVEGRVLSPPQLTDDEREQIDSRSNQGNSAMGLQFESNAPIEDAN